MKKNILILIACGIIAWLSLLAFRVLDSYAFIIMEVIAFVLLLSAIKKPKFGNKKDKKKENT